MDLVTCDPASARQEHVDAVLAAGWPQEAVFDAVTVAALFAFFNRWVDGNGVPDVPPGFYERRLAETGDFRYA